MALLLKFGVKKLQKRGKNGVKWLTKNTSHDILNLWKKVINQKEVFILQKHYTMFSNLSQERYFDIGENANMRTLKRVAIHKGYNVPIIKNLLELGENKKALNIEQCGTFLEIVLDETGVERVKNSNFCRERLCSVCAWRRQARFLATTEPALQLIDADYANKAQYIFITLTVRNCKGDELSDTITQLLRAWDRLYKRKPFATYSLGAIRSCEVTYNTADNTYHPHLHVLLLMRNSYFNKSNIIDNYKLSILWENALQVDYTPVTYMQAIKQNAAGADEQMSAVLETIKYTLKTKEYAISADVTSTLMKALKGRRLISFSGIIARKRAELKAGDIYTDLNDDISPTLQARSILYSFTAAGWQIVER